MTVDLSTYQHIKMTVDASYTRKFRELQEDFLNLMLEKDAKISEIISRAELECRDFRQLETILDAYK